MKGWPFLDGSLETVALEKEIAMRNLSHLFLLLAFLFGSVGFGMEETKISIHKVTLRVESSSQGSNPSNSIGIDSKTINEEPILLTLKEQSQEEGRPAPRGIIYSGNYSTALTVHGVQFEVMIDASVTVIDGKTGPYSVSGLVRRPRFQKAYESLTGVSTKSQDSLKQVLSVSGWSKEKFWINEAKKTIGQVQLVINLNEF